MHKKCMTSNGTHGKKTLLITKASNTSGHTTQWCAHAMVLTHGKSPRVIPRAVTPSALKGCVGTLKNGYVRNGPLSRAPRIQSTSHVTNQSQVDAYKYTSNSHVTYQPHTNKTDKSKTSCFTFGGNKKLQPDRPNLFLARCENLRRD